ncbi:MAG: hypothetical protein Kow0068_11820 [Marinilabiliales bacterium]
MWIATDKGLIKFNPNNNIFEPFIKEIPLPEIEIYSLLLDSKNILWIGTKQGLYTYDIENKKLNNYAKINNYQVYDIIEDKDHIIWLATYGNGLFMSNSTKTDFYNYSAENVIFSNGKQMDNLTNCLLEDNSGIIWIGTFGQGLTYVNKNLNKFNLYRANSGNNNIKLSSNVIWKITGDKKGNIYLATDNGINIIDKKRRKNTILMANETAPNTLKTNYIRSLCFDYDSILWIGTFDRGVFTYNQNTKHYKPFMINNKNLINGIVWTIEKDIFGFVWIGTTTGLYRYNKNNGEIKTYLNKGQGSISSNEIYNIITDRHNNLWICTNNGLNRYDYDNDKFIVYRKDKNNDNSLNTNKIFTVYHAKNGVYWIGTVGGGLNRYDTKSNTFKHYGINEGLTNSVVYAVVEDEVNHLWLTTNQGVFQFDPYTEVFINYNVEDGIQSNEFNLNSYYQTEDGEIFFGGLNGLNSFYPYEITKNEFIPPIVITDVKIFNKSLNKQLLNNDTLILNYDQNFIEIEFSALDFTSPLKNRYRYKLEGFDKNWVYCDANKRFVEYSNLLPGTYKFFVKGSNSAGLWNKNPVCLNIIVTPPWWQTTIFRILFVLAVLLLIGGSIFGIIRKIRRKHNIEKQIIDLQRKSLRLQMNPHFIFNTLNSIQYFILKNDKLASNKYLSMFSKLMRKILDNSDKNYITIREEVETVKLYIELEQLRFDGKFDYEIDIVNDEEIIEKQIPAMILQPYVENAIIHGLVHKDDGKGQLRISLENIGNYLIFTVEDNGIGRERAMEIRNMSKHKHRSMGKEITQSRLELIKMIHKKEIDLKIDDLTDDEGNPVGTRVQFKIPLIN